VTEIGVCGIFIPDLVQASTSGANGKVSNRLGVGGATACCGGGCYIRRDKRKRITNETRRKLKIKNTIKCCA
jgi:hypothetical protein